MDNPKNTKYSSHLVLTAVLSGSITIGVSLVYMLLCIAAIILRFTCDAGKSDTGASYFWKTIISAYILEGTCEHSISAIELVKNDITGEYTVFVLTAITLSISVLCLVTAITLVATIQDESATRYLTCTVSIYIGSCIASLVIDLTTATHFGIDYTFLTSKLDELMSGSGSNYHLEVLRQGAFLLMGIALKGYVIPLMNIILIILLIVYATEHRKLMKSDQHSIHKLGALTAFDQPRKTEDNNWLTQPETYAPFARGAQVNNGFANDEDTPRLPKRAPSVPSRSDYNNSNRLYDRSDSWHHTQPNLSQTSRPFTYLEDVKRPVPNRPPPSPAVEPDWRRDPWPQGPPLPHPDYSPQPRRLKSALKPAYM